LDLTTARLVKQKILLSGVTTLTRLVARVFGIGRRAEYGEFWLNLGVGDEALRKKHEEMGRRSEFNAFDAPVLAGISGDMQRTPGYDLQFH
jgi:hypothetical protein